MESHNPISYPTLLTAFWAEHHGVRIHGVWLIVFTAETRRGSDRLERGNCISAGPSQYMFPCPTADARGTQRPPYVVSPPTANICLEPGLDVSNPHCAPHLHVLYFIVKTRDFPLEICGIQPANPLTSRTGKIDSDFADLDLRGANTARFRFLVLRSPGAAVSGPALDSPYSFSPGRRSLER
jgi:hypothetical protein